MGRRLREEEVMTIRVLHERGCSNRGIARTLGVDEKAVRYRLGRLRDGRPDAEGVGALLRTRRGRERLRDLKRRIKKGRSAPDESAFGARSARPSIINGISFGMLCWM